VNLEWFVREYGCQMFADILGVPMTVSQCQETGALGAAISAGTAAGVFRSLDDGISAMVRKSAVYEPRKERQPLFESRYRFFRGLADDLPGRWKRYVADASAA
jgi:L-xylulokinase